MERYLEPPDDGVKVSACADCGDDLCAGDGVVTDKDTGDKFCNMGCAVNFAKHHPETYPPGDYTFEVVTLEAPEDHWTEEDALREADDL